VRSSHSEITTAFQAKAGFPNTVTLHGFAASPSGVGLVGTDVVLSGLSSGDVEKAKNFFYTAANS
jgi:hypothetical protein